MGVTRTCTDCAETFPLTEDHFPWNDKARGIHRRNCRSCHALKRKRYREKTKGRVVRNNRQDNPRLPIGPLADWLTGRKDYSPTEIAKVTGKDEAVIRRLTDGKAKWTSLDTVDRVLVAFSCSPQMLPELYPELYQFGESCS